MKSVSHSDPRRVTLLLLILAAAGLAASFPGVHERVIEGLAVAEGFITEHAFLGAVVFMLVSALSAMLVLFSGVVLVPIGIQAWGEFGCFLLLWAGWFLGGVMTYAIGRYFGRPAVERMLAPSAMDAYAARVPEAASFWTALLIQLAFPSDVVGYFFGLLHFRRRTYLASLLCAELPYAFATVFMGNAFIERNYWVLLAGVLVAAAVLAWQWWMRVRTQRH